MEYYDVLARRRMYRNFSTDTIEDSVLERILLAAPTGPSAGFAQGFDFLVLRSPDALTTFWNIATTSEWRTGTKAHLGLVNAPVVIIPLANRSAYLERYSEVDKSYSNLNQRENWPVPYWYIDCAFATMLILGAIANEDLGALFFGLFRNLELLKAAFAIPINYEPIGAIALGHPQSREISKSVLRGRRDKTAQFHLNNFTDGYRFSSRTDMNNAPET